jgi:hypothetical protein
MVPEEPEQWLPEGKFLGRLMVLGGLGQCVNTVAKNEEN